MTEIKGRERNALKTGLSPVRGKRSALHSSWWVVFFVAVCAFVYFNAAQKKEEVILSLDSHLQALNSEKAALLQEKEDLLLQINSQSDPAWIQLTLMKGLGLVPEGQMKVYFYSDELR